jgi:hypothetical protein
MASHRNWGLWSVPFPGTGLLPDPLTHQMIASPCWNGRHSASLTNLRDDYADRRVCQRSQCQCHCHHEEQWYVKEGSREQA